MAKAPTAIKVPYAKLIGVLGKAPKDSAVPADAEAGKAMVKSHFITAKQAGFTLSLNVPRKGGGNRKVVSSLYLHADDDDHRGFSDLPEGLAFTTRSALLAIRPTPSKSSNT